jgi:L-threonylcarbamoyladenylate synthase
MSDESQRAVALLLAGELVGLPAETVYGLGADARNPQAVAKIFAAKGRPADHPLIVHLSSAEGMKHWAADIPAEAWALAKAFWPGPLTLILKKQAWVPDAVTGGQDTVGLRIPAHPVALELLRQLTDTECNANAGIAAPSANRFGRISPTTAQHVRDELGDQVALVLEGGACQVGIESTILDLSRATPAILRPGQLSPAQLAAVLGFEPPIVTAVGAPRVSGSLESHYAPQTRLYLLDADPLLNYLNVVRHRGGRCGVIAHDLPKMAAQPHEWRMLPADPDGYAREIYAVLRELDGLALDAIVVESLPSTSGWAAVADRLRRAAA